MKAAVFEGRVAPAGQVPIPAEVARQLPVGAPVRVILLWDTDEDADWQKLGAERFAAAYAPEDEVYEQLLSP
jgi:hypothetical protein